MTQRRQAALWLLRQIDNAGGIADIAEVLDGAPQEFWAQFQRSSDLPCPAFHLLARTRYVVWDTFGAYIWLTDAGRAAISRYS
jgi:hypothetical protein